MNTTMKLSEQVKDALKIVDRHIRIYQIKLIHELELMAELELNNGNLKVDCQLDDCKKNAERYQVILANMATIRRAIKTGHNGHIKTYLQDNNCLYSEIGKMQREIWYKCKYDFIL